MVSSVYGTALYAADVSVLSDPALYAQALAAVPPEKREQAERYSRSGDKLQALGADLLLIGALKRAGFSVGPGDFALGEYGKPYLKKGKLHFNLSHSGDWVLCALSDCEVGCDVEKRRPFDSRVLRRFAPEEQEDILSRKDENERENRFFRYWTLKESFLKATGQGLHLPLNGFRVIMGEEISVRQSFDDRSYYFKEYTELPDCCCAVCTAGAPELPELRILDLRELLKKGKWDEK